MTPSPLTVSYVLSADDWARAQVASARLWPVPRRWRTVLWSLYILFWGSVGFTMAALAWSVDSSPAFKGYAQVIGLFAGVALLSRLVLDVASRKVAWRSVEQGGQPFKVDLRLSLDWLEVELRGILFRSPWSGIQATTQDDRNLYVLFATGSMLPVPRQASAEVVAVILERAPSPLRSGS